MHIKRCRHTHRHACIYIIHIYKLVMSMVGLAVGVVLVSVVSGLVVMSVAVEVMVVVSESIVVPLGDSWVGCAVMGLGGTGLAVMWGGGCWVLGCP